MEKDIVRQLHGDFEKTITSCINAGYEPGDHFAHMRKMVELGSG